MESNTVQIIELRPSHRSRALPRPAAPAAPAASLREGWRVMTALLLATLVVTLDNTVLNVALPSISADLHASTSALQWIVNAYSLLFGGLLLTGGSLADRIGRKRVLLGGLTAFGLVSSLVVVVHSAPGLIALRALNGAAAAFLMPSCLALLYRAFTREARPAALGLFGAVAALGFVVGPLVGGALLEAFAWQSVFLVNVPIAAIALAFAARSIAPDGERAAGGADLPGTALSIIAMGAFVFALVAGPDHGWTSPDVLLPAVIAVAAVVAFGWWELRAAHPMLDLAMLGRRAVAGPGAAQAALMFAIAGALFLITQQLQVIDGYSPLEAGVRAAPTALGLIAGGPAILAISRRIGGPWAAATGLLITAAATAEIALGIRHGYWPLAGGLLGIGIGVRMCMTPVALAVLDGLPAEAAGVGSALNDTFQEVGGALGVALLGSVFNALYRADLPHHVPAAARASIQGALSLHDSAVAVTARHAFATGAQGAFLLCAGVLAVTAIVARLTVPRDVAVEE